MKSEMAANGTCAGAVMAAQFAKSAFKHEAHEGHEDCRWKNFAALPQTILYFSSSGTPSKFLSMMRNDSGQSDS